MSLPVACCVRPGALAAAVFALCAPASYAQVVPLGLPVPDRIEVSVAGEQTCRIGDRSEMRLGRISYQEAGAIRRRDISGPRAFIIVRPLHLRVARASGAPGQIALSAFLVRNCYPCVVRINGIGLDATPRLVLSRVALNSITEHRIEVEVPATLPGGDLDAEIGWQVEEK